MEGKQYATRSAAKAQKSEASAEDQRADSKPKLLPQEQLPTTPADRDALLIDESEPAVTMSTVRAPRSISSGTSRLSRSEREARRMRAEYEAEAEIVKLREGMIKKKLALDLAELAVDEEMEQQDEPPRSVVSEPRSRVQQWLQDARTTPGFAAVAASVPVRDLQKAAPLPTQRTDIEQLAEAIGKLARTRPLPRQVYDIPTFDGNPADWLGFEKAYWSTTEMHNFRPFENMARLRVALVGDAKAAVEDLIRTSSDPDDIIKALEEEFGHPNQLLKCALEKVRNLPRVTESGRELRSFTNVVRNCVSVLKNVRADGYINNPQLVNELLNKLTPYQRAQYGEFAMRKDINSGIDLRVSPNLNILVEFLTQLTQVSSYYVALSDASEVPKLTPLVCTTAGRRDKGAAPVRTTHRLNTQVESVATVTNAEGRDKVVCVMCDGDHKLFECDQFKRLTVNERWNFAKDNKLCFKCLIKSHSRRFCRAKRCSKCQWSHHELLHTNSEATAGPSPSVALPPIAPSASASPNENVRAFETVTNVGEYRARALLKVIPITIMTSSGDERATYALLDDGASVSLIDDKLASDIDGPVVPLRLITARGHCATDNYSRSVKVYVRGPNGVCHDIALCTMSNLNLPSQTLPARVLEDNAHLRQLDCSEMREAKPMVLLGQDNWKLIVGKEIRQGKSGRPVASLTLLGWVVHGPLGASASVNSSYTESANCMSTLRPDLHNIVKAQFELEAIGISQEPRQNTNSERALCILNSTSRRVTGDWEVGLLWNRDDIEMPDDYEYARRHSAGIDRKTDRDSEFANAYTKQVNRLSKNYARNVEGGIKALAVNAIMRKHYVHDYLDRVDSVDTAQQLIADVTHIHRAVGFDIRGWVTSSSELRKRLPSVVPGRVKLDKSIPRLEPQAAVLACRLAVTVKSEINNVVSNEYLWTDSKAVLMWINSEARDYQKYPACWAYTI